MINRRYCSSSFLMYRTIPDINNTFDGTKIFDIRKIDKGRTVINNSNELETHLRKVIGSLPQTKIALALSGGIDSAILAKMMPAGTTAYTFKCVVPGVSVTDESPAAARYAKDCGLNHKIVEVYWEDIEKYAPVLMLHKHEPIHSIEVQIYKAALQAKKDGFDYLVFGEQADVIYGGMDQLLLKDWTYGEFIDRYSFVAPYKVLKDYELVTEPIKKYTNENGYVDVHAFQTGFCYGEGMSSYYHACTLAGINYVAPYSMTKLGIPLDLNRIRSGEGKYIVREVFKRLYPDYEIPKKTPMPRPLNEWMQNWKGPQREDFWINSTDHMTGDQKWLVWALETYLNLIDGKTAG